MLKRGIVTAVAIGAVHLLLSICSHTFAVEPTKSGLSAATQRSVIWSESALMAEPAGELIDLLSRVDLRRDVASGDWNQTTTALIGSAQSRVYLPVKSPEDYQLKFAVRRLEGVDTLIVGFVMAGRQGMLVLDGWDSKMSGLSVDGREANDNCTTWRGSLFKQGTAQIVITVHSGHLHATFDDRTIVDWHGNPERLSLHYEITSRESPFLVTANAKYIVESATLMPIKPQPAVAPPTSLERQVEVLPLLDVDRDSARGIWIVGKKGLSSPDNTGYSQIYLPTVVPREYTLSLTVEMPPNCLGEALVIGLLKDDAYFQLTSTNAASGLEAIDGKRWMENETRTAGSLLTLGKAVRLDVTVTNSGIRVEVDGKTRIDWRGDSRRLSMPSEWPLSDARRLYLGTMRHFIFREVKLGPPIAPPKLPDHPSLSVGKPLDLLTVIDPARDAISGTWERDGAALRCRGDAEDNKLVIPFDVPEEYKLTLRVTRRDGGTHKNEALCLGLPIGNSKADLVVDGAGSTISGMTLDNRPFNDNATTYRGGPVIPAGALTEIVFFVRKTGVHATSAGRTILDWTGYPERLTFHLPRATSGPRLSLGSWHQGFRFEKVELEPLPTTSIPSVPALPADGKLLPIIDTKRDARKGEWKLDADGLLTPNSTAARLCIPVTPPDKYTFSATVERRVVVGQDLFFGLIVGGRTCGVSIDGGHGHVAGLELLDGKRFFDKTNFTRREYETPLLPQGKSVEVRCHVLLDTVVVTCDDREVVRWHGDSRRLSLESDYRSPNDSQLDARQLWLGSFETTFLIRNLELKPLTDADAEQLLKTFSGPFPTTPQVVAAPVATPPVVAAPTRTPPSPSPSLPSPPSATVPPAWKTFEAATKPVSSVLWTPDERHLIATSSDDWCRVWSLETGRVQKEFRVDGVVAAMMPDGEHILIASNSKKKLTLYRWSTGESVRQFDKPRDAPLCSLCVSNLGDRMAAGEEKTGACTVWDVGTGNVLHSLMGQQGIVAGVCFTPDGRRLVTGGANKNRILWDVDSGKELARWSTPAFAVACLDISSDGRFLVESGGHTEVVVRELATQKVIQTLKGHESGWIMRCRFLKDSTRVVTSCFDKTVRIWDAMEGRELFTIRGFKHYQFGLSFSPSGTMIAAGSGGDLRDGNWWPGEDFAVRLWKVPKTIWRHRTGPISLAVLGFETIGTSPAQSRLRETFVDGVVQSLLSRPEIRLIERNSAAFLRAEQDLRAGFTTETAKPSELEAAEVLLSGTLGEANGKLEVVIRMHVVGRVEPIAQWKVTGTADKLDDVYLEVMKRVVQELDLPATSTRPGAADKPPIRQPRLAVLPFRNQTADGKLDDWSEGITDLMTVALSQVASISLVERQALEAVLQEQRLQAAQLSDPVTAIRLGQLAGADWALSGSMTGTGEKLQLSVRVVEVATTRVLLVRQQEVKVAEIDEGLAKLVTTLERDLFPHSPKPTVGLKPVVQKDSTHSLEYASLLSRAKRLLAAKKPIDAATAYEQALLLKSDSIETRLELLRCREQLKEWSQVLEVAQSMRDQPEYQKKSPHIRYEVASAEIDALARLKRPEEIRRRAAAWEQECGHFQADIALAWKFAAGVRAVDTQDSQQFAAEVRKHDHHSDVLRQMYVDAFVRTGKGSRENKLSGNQDVVTVLDHVLDACSGKRDDDAKRWASVIIPNAIDFVTILTRDQKIERFERARDIFGWIPEIHIEIIARLAPLQRFSGRFRDAAESYLNLARSPFTESDSLPAPLDRTERAANTNLDHRINGWAGWAQMRATVEPNAAQSALETALAEVGAVHGRGPELIAAATETKVPIRWPEHLALIWGGGHSTWQSWQNVLTPLGLRAHPIHRIGVNASDLEPYELVVLVRSGPIVLLPSEILALRNHVARGGRLLVVLSPGWDSAQPAVHQTLLDLFGFQPGAPTELRALSTQLADHPVTRGLTGVMAKCAVSIQSPSEHQLVLSGDRCVLAAREYREGKIAVASFGQWFIPDSSIYDGKWTEKVSSDARAERPFEDLPFAEGNDAQRPLLDQLLKWLISPVESPTRPQIESADWYSAATAVQEVQAKARPAGDLPGIFESLVNQTSAGTVEREEALWFVGEASQGGYYFFKPGEAIGFTGLTYGLVDGKDWPAQPEYYDRLINEFPDSPLRGLAQFRKADSLRRNGSPPLSVNKTLEQIQSKSGSTTWAWQQLRLGRLKHALKLQTDEGLSHYQAVADQMPLCPEKGLAVQAIAMIHHFQNRREETRRSLELLLNDIPDFYYGGASENVGFQRWKPMDDTAYNYLHNERLYGASALGGSLRDLARQQLEHLKAKK